MINQIWAGRHADTVIQAHGVSPIPFNWLDGRLDMQQLEQNVKDALRDIANEYGRFKACNFYLNTQIFLSDETKSPIEQIFYFALSAYKDLWAFNFLSNRTPENTEELACYLYPQKTIGDYRVDFLLEFIDIEMNLHQVVIELDGHAFHDKDKEQRAYEKARDRYLTRSGYKVLHFTGSELVKDPYKCVLEAFIALTAVDEEFLANHNPNNPFWIKDGTCQKHKTVSIQE